MTMTPDGRTMFVGIQHPGEDATAANPTQFSNWPQAQFAVESDGVTALAGRTATLVGGGHHQGRRRHHRHLSERMGRTG